MSTGQHIFSNFSILDPARMQQEIEDSGLGYGPTLFDTFSILDPRRREAQIAAQWGSDQFRVRHIDDPQQTPISLDVSSANAWN